MRWRQDRLLGGLDRDLAAAWDPALNTAYLVLWHGADGIEAIARSPEVAWRARIWLEAMSLESIFDVSLDPRRDLDALAERIRPRLAMAAQEAGD